MSSKINQHNWVWILGTLVIMGIASAFGLCFKASGNNAVKVSELESEMSDGMRGVLNQIHAHETGSSGSHIGMDERIKSMQRDVDQLTVGQRSMANDISDIKSMIRSD